MRFATISLLVLIAAAPASRPTTRPATQPSARLQAIPAAPVAAIQVKVFSNLPPAQQIPAIEAAIAELQPPLQAATERRLVALRATPEHIELQKKVDEASARVESFRGRKTPEAQLEAGNAYLELKGQLASLEEAALSAEPDVQQYRTVMADYRRQLSVLQEKEKQAKMAAVLNDPIRRATLDHKVVQGMTLDQVRKSLLGLQVVKSGPWYEQNQVKGNDYVFESLRGSVVRTVFCRMDLSGKVVQSTDQTNVNSGGTIQTGRQNRRN